MRPLLSHPDSLLWVDMVDREPVERPEKYPRSVQQFMRGMRILGEPFTFGTDDAPSFLQSAGLRCLESVTSDLYLPGKEDVVYSIYQFCVAGALADGNNAAPATFQAARFDGAANGILRPHSMDLTPALMNGHNGHNGQHGADASAAPKQSQRRPR
jgi:hypothetical protein